MQIAALCAYIATTIGGIAAIVGMFRKLHDVHLTLNSRLDQLIEASQAVGRQQERDAHGVIKGSQAEGRQQERDAPIKS
jgi:hypothetical protein